MGEKLFLFIKEPERVSTPKNCYEKIELSSNYNDSLRQIEELLEFSDEKLIHKCKQRLTKLTQYLKRLESIKGTEKMEYSVRKKKLTRIERVNALKVLNKIDIEREVEKELILRLECGVYGTELQDKLSCMGEKAVNKGKRASRKRKQKYIAYFEESDSDVENIGGRKSSKKQKNILKW
jgi:protein MAK16